MRSAPGGAFFFWHLVAPFRIATSALLLTPCRLTPRVSRRAGSAPARQEGVEFGGARKRRDGAAARGGQGPTSVRPP